jgi:hypothetical protein
MEENSKPLSIPPFQRGVRGDGERFGERFSKSLEK